MPPANNAAAAANMAYAKEVEALRRAPIPLPRFHRLVLDGDVYCIGEAAGDLLALLGADDARHGGDPFR